MRPDDFFNAHPVFTVPELGRFLAARGSNTPSNRKTLIAHHEKQGRILRVRRGLYAVVPPGQDPTSCAVDAYLLAANMAADAILGYHTALEFHGKAYSSFQELQYLTATSARDTTFRSFRFRPVRFPKRLRAKRKELFGVETADRRGMDVRVTSLERTLVDVLDRPDLAGGWEEIWRSLESIEFFNLDDVIQYTLLLENRTTVGKVGFFLEQHAESLMVEAKHLERLRAHQPNKPHYLERGGKGPSRYVRGWNVVVPEKLLARSWQDVA